MTQKRIIIPNPGGDAMGASVASLLEFLEQWNTVAVEDTIIIDMSRVTFVNPTVTTRKAVEIIATNMSLSENDDVVFNFKHIGFISRAFADEFIHFIQNNQINARFINANQVVSEMLNVVEKNMEGRKRSYHNIAITTFTQKEQLQQLLSLI